MGNASVEARRNVDGRGLKAGSLYYLFTITIILLLYRYIKYLK